MKAKQDGDNKVIEALNEKNKEIEEMQAEIKIMKQHLQNEQANTDYSKKLQQTEAQLQGRLSESLKLQSQLSDSQKDQQLSMEQIFRKTLDNYYFQAMMQGDKSMVY